MKDRKRMGDRNFQPARGCGWEAPPGQPGGVAWSWPPPRQKKPKNDICVIANVRCFSRFFWWGEWPRANKLHRARQSPHQQETGNKEPQRQRQKRWEGGRLAGGWHRGRRRRPWCQPPAGLPPGLRCARRAGGSNVGRHGHDGDSPSRGSAIVAMVPTLLPPAWPWGGWAGNPQHRARQSPHQQETGHKEPICSVDVQYMFSL